MWDILLLDCHAATMAGGSAAPYGAVRDAAIGIEGGKLCFVGARNTLPAAPETCARVVRRLKGTWVTPGLIDCHTHLVFGGNRAQEWEMRRNGASYAEIAASGGGILSTVRATRDASFEELVSAAGQRLAAMKRQGVTTVEIKSGYGLDLENEIKMLRAAHDAGKLAQMRISSTFLGAHAVPPEFAADRTAYVDLVCETMIPELARAKLADAVDAFCETIAFSPAESERIFAAAAAHGLRVKLHAEQMSDSGGVELAARYNALSADHLEYASESGIAAMAKAGTVAVLLPVAFYFLGESRKPPVDALRRAGVPIAVATDCNPGTAPATAPLLAINMACTLFGLSPEEALAGFTCHAARALGREQEIGSLAAGKLADLAVWNIQDPSELAYWIGAELLADRYLGGRSDRNESAA